MQFCVLPTIVLGTEGGDSPAFEMPDVSVLGSAPFHPLHMRSTFNKDRPNSFPP